MRAFTKFAVVSIMTVFFGFMAASMAMSANAYSSTAVYNTGDLVEHNGVTYLAQWWTKGVTPGSNGSTVWVPQYDANEDGTLVWYEGRVFLAGEKTRYNGTLYEANWWTKSVPGSDGSWKTIYEGDDAKVYHADTIYYEGDTVVYNGVTYRANHWIRGILPGTNATAWIVVNGDGKEEETPPGGEPEENEGVWVAGTLYAAGDRVVYNGFIYEAACWTKSEPGTDNTWNLVSDTEEPGNEGDTFDVNTAYNKGDKVVYKGVTYVATAWTYGEVPGTGSAWVVEGEEVIEPEPTDPEPTDPTEPTDPEVENAYDPTKIYYAGDKVVYNGVTYVAKHWIRDITPGTKDTAWEVVREEIIDPVLPTEDTEFKIVGYFPYWKPSLVNRIQYDKVTHIMYAFAIPDGNGGLLDLENPNLAKQIIAEAHKYGVKVSLSVGGWSYNGEVLEARMVASTNTAAKVEKFSTAIVNMANKYGFDGVDIDWEHPRYKKTHTQYEDLMWALRNKLGKDKLLTSAVLAGVTRDGQVYYDSAAHSDSVLAAVDWIHVMAYAVDNPNLDYMATCAKYWRDTRSLDPEKIVMGVPGFSYPVRVDYSDIVTKYSEALKSDTFKVSGTTTYYNGYNTMKAKTEWAAKNVGGIVVWELAQDTTGSLSFQKAIAEAAYEQGVFIYNTK